MLLCHFAALQGCQLYNVIIIVEVLLLAVHVLKVVLFWDDFIINYPFIQSSRRLLAVLQKLTQYEARWNP